MKEIKAQSLENVAGGSKKSDQLNATLQQVQSSISSLASQNNNSSSSTTTALVLAMALSNRQQQVVAAPACSGCTTVVQPSFGFRFRARIRF